MAPQYLKQKNRPVENKRQWAFHTDSIFSDPDPHLTIFLGVVRIKVTCELW